ncbi:MAG: outer membrane beta-barrel protein [Rikenellaceae bacterium]
MQDIEFDKRVKELMDGHLEMPGEGSWNNLLIDLNKRKRARVLYFRRVTYASVAVAASLLLLLVLGKESPVPASIENLNNLIENAPKPKINEVTGSAPVPKVNISKKRRVAVTVKVEEVSSPIVVAENEVKQDAGKKGKDKSTQIADSDKRSYQSYKFENEAKSKKFGKGLFYALSTNLSPSMYSKSISMLSVALGYQNDFVPTNLKETIQPQSVSDTKYSMPLTFGIQVQYPVNQNLSVGAGLSYSLLVSHYQQFSYNDRLDIQQSLHYLGIPVNAYYNLLQNNKFKVYVSAGFAIEKGIVASYRTYNSGVKDLERHSISGVQFSLSGGLGAEFKMNKEVGLYFDPALAYYFKCNQPENIRTTQPMQYKFELGMRFHL